MQTQKTMRYFQYTVKKTLKKTFAYKLIRQYEDKWLLKKRAPFFEDLKRTISEDTSIISSNCFAGRIMQDLGMEYNSPTLGLYFMFPDYIEFLEHLDYYLTKSKIQFVDHSKYKLGDDRREEATFSNHWYPIGLLDGKVEIHFLHYYTETEAAEKWYRRAARVNFDNLLIIGMEQNMCKQEDIFLFDKLSFRHKLFFSSRILNIPSNCFIKEFEGQEQVGDPYRCAHLFYKELVKRIG